VYEKLRFILRRAFILSELLLCYGKFSINKINIIPRGHRAANRSFPLSARAIHPRGRIECEEISRSVNYNIIM